ncbi:hypothetical protein ACP4OV_014894 [Aristida adscensionis]
MDERKVRLVLSRDQVTDHNVVITPIKLPRNTSIEEGFEDEPIDSYKDWLSYMHQRDEALGLEDKYREDTVETYKEWLRLEGKLDAINAYVNHSTHINLVDSSQDSNPTPPGQRPSHARRHKEKGNGRGTLKGYKASNKRIRQGNQKLKVEFSRLGGAVGSNSRTFTDEIVMFTRKRAPLIGVRTWRDIDQDVKNSIAYDVLARWDLENNDDIKKKIWTIANECYKGWRSTFSATYKAYNTYDERMRHKPEDLDIVEWHYLVKYFGTEKFQSTSNKNSNNRLLKKTQHLTGSKPFSQCSYEQRDSDIGEEPNDLELWMSTHSKNGQWTNQASRDVYDKARSKILDREMNADQNFVSQAEKNQIFQRAYREITKCKSSKIHGNRYMASHPTKRQLLIEDYQNKVRSEETLHRDHVELMGAFGQLQQTIEHQEAEREAERAEHKRQLEELMKAHEADKEALRQEFMSMMQAAQQQAALQQGNKDGNKIAEVAAATNVSEANDITRQLEETSPQHNQGNNSPQVQLKANPPASTIRNTRSSAATNKMVPPQDKDRNATTTYVTTQQLKDEGKSGKETIIKELARQQ